MRDSGRFLRNEVFIFRREIEGIGGLSGVKSGRRDNRGQWWTGMGGVYGRRADDRLSGMGFARLQLEA
jgi:hypothetical protein